MIGPWRKCVWDEQSPLSRRFIKFSGKFWISSSVNHKFHFSNEWLFGCLLWIAVLMLAFFNFVKWCSFLGVLKKRVPGENTSTLWTCGQGVNILENSSGLNYWLSEKKKHRTGLDHFGSCGGIYWPCVVGKICSKHYNWMDKKKSCRPVARSGFGRGGEVLFGRKWTF